MGNTLRDRRTVAELAAAGQVIEIADNIGSFSRLSKIVEADLSALEADKIPSAWRDRQVSGEIQFGFAAAADAVPCVFGSASADVDAVCQRCLEPFRLSLNIEPRLLLVDEQQAMDEFDDFEVWELEEESLRPQDIVEELLVMAMPFSARHDNMTACKAFSTADDDAIKLVKPFAALASQMQRIEKDPDE